MNLQILSDLHLDFHGGAELGFIESLDPSGVDALVIAGDLCSADLLGPVLGAFCERYGDVIYVTGNHEYYDTGPSELHDLLGSLHAALPKLHWLENATAELGGVRIAGTTLWFRDDPDNLVYEKMMADFQLIRDFKPWVYTQNARALEFLRLETTRANVVVTHHMPSKRSIAPRFEDDPLNRFFLCDLDDLLHDAGPALWIHGHTHASIDTRVGRTRIVCNPFGYLNWEVNPEFDEKLVVEAEPGC